MSKTIAICSNIPVFWNNKVLDINHCKKYFGASWMPIFATLMKQYGYDVCSGDVVLGNINKGVLNPENILIIQELNAKHGKQLLKLGAVGLVLTGAESPLFSYYFYDHLRVIATKFQIRNLFDGSYTLFDNTINTTQNFQFYFPSYFLDDKTYNQNWDTRDFMVIIAANKFGRLSTPKNIKQLINFIIHSIYRKISHSFKIAKSNELHSKRLKCIKFFGARSLLSVFGSSWDNFSNFKKDKQLIKILQDLKPSFAEDKIITLSKYKFAICFENIAFDGYITEKIIHCFLAGVIPIYLGAPNITRYIPQNTFINFRDFKSLEDLYKYLQSITEKQAQDIITNGKNFLVSSEGKKYSYEYVAQDMLKIVNTFNDNNR